MRSHSDHTEIEDRGNFPTDVRDLPESHPSEVVSLANGEAFDLGIAPMVKQLGRYIGKRTPARSLTSSSWPFRPSPRRGQRGRGTSSKTTTAAL